MADFNYTANKIHLAIKVLATHPEDAKTRLIAAYNSYLVFASVDDMPDDLKPYLESIHTKMTERGHEDIWPSAAHATLYRKHKKTAAKIAKEIFDLYMKIEKRRWLDDNKTNA